LDKLATRPLFYDSNIRFINSGITNIVVSLFTAVQPLSIDDADISKYTINIYDRRAAYPNKGCLPKVCEFNVCYI